MDVTINYEHERFSLGVKKEDSLFSFQLVLGCHPSDFLSIQEELKDKQFLISREVDGDKKEVSFRELEKVNWYLDERFDPDHVKRKTIIVKDPDNIQKIIVEHSCEILVKAVKEEYYGESFEYFVKEFDYAKEYGGYKEFIEFFKKSFLGGFKITEDEEFPYRVLKFYSKDSLIKAVKIQDEKISFLESFAEEYKKLQVENIKESLEKVNEELKLEGKKPLQIGLDDE